MTTEELLAAILAELEALTVIVDAQSTVISGVAGSCVLLVVLLVSGWLWKEWVGRVR